jgi:tetratricopeptide (TPR) repeat protein
MMRRCLLGLISAAALFGQPRPADLCVPPPGGSPPPLPAKLLEGQGKVTFKMTTTSDEAQAFFQQGLAQLHSFWAREAERSFLQAAALDPEAPMPHWGIALAAAGDYRPRFQIDRMNELFGKRPLDAKSRAVAAAQKAVELSRAPGKATDLEKMYIASAAARRNLESKDPDEDYIAGLRAIVAKYPSEVEAKVMLSLHLMRGFTLPEKTPRPGTMVAVAILRDLLKDAPDHPGVHHYVIHGFEGSTFARDAWESCRRYAELVSNIPHALHMPGHIWAQTGKYAEAVKSFGDAAVNERGYMAADALYGNGHHGHNVHYLATAYSFSGKYGNATAAARELLDQHKENPRQAAAVDDVMSTWRQGWFALMRILVQSENWDAILDGKTLPASDKPRLKAWRHWATGLALASRRDVDGARTESDAMNKAIDELKTAAKLKDPPELRAAHEELQAHIALARRDVDGALKQFGKAAKLQEELRYTEPPDYPRPVLEAMGRAAARNGRPDAAESAFRKALEQHPASYVSTRGLRELGRGESGAAGQE